MKLLRLKWKVKNEKQISENFVKMCVFRKIGNRAKVNIGDLLITKNEITII